MKTYYYRTYDKTLWRLERHHEVEVSSGCYYGAMTCYRVGNKQKKWTVVDSVYMQMKKNGILKEYKLLDSEILVC